MELTNDQIERIEMTIQSFVDVLKDATKFRLAGWDDFDSNRSRSEGMGQQMVEAGNISMQVEEHLTMMMILQNHVHMAWAEIESKHLQAMSRHANQQYVPKEGKLAGAIIANAAIYETKSRLDSMVVAGSRAVDRLEKLGSIASRVVSITLGS